ncbi:MAG: tripartite tricarboxylate transporter TctB family protein [Acidobacteria bacterium]|nr:tripartite tricarboxylate transporter TctB family protein [Acidobacteriota bacterium]
MNRDLAFGLLGAALAAGYYRLAASIPQSALADGVGPRGLPIAYAVVLLGLSLILIGRSVRTRNREPRTRNAEPGSQHPAVRVVGMLAIGAAYIALVPWLGYVVTVAGLLLAVTWYLSGVVTRTIVLVAASGAVVFWLLFVRLLGIPHPPGFWARLF